MLVTALKKRSQVENDPQDNNEKLIKSVLDIINAPANQQSKKETADGRQSNEGKPPENIAKIVLHIDDDAEDREFVGDAIKNIDPSFILHEAKNGEEGIAYLTRAKASGTLPCLIILDINMPGMDGLETYEEIKQDEVLKAIPTVIFTTSAIFKRIKNEETERLPIFIKPFNIKEFIVTVRKMLTHCKD
jgi:CheY-like chemotaxis protein